MATKLERMAEEYRVSIDAMADAIARSDGEADGYAWSEAEFYGKVAAGILSLFDSTTGTIHGRKVA